MEPATGDVFRMQTQYKPGGMFGEYIDLGSTILEATQMLIDTESFESFGLQGTNYNRIGFFTSLADFNAYWTPTNNPIADENTLNITFEPDQLMSGVRLRPADTFNSTNKRFSSIHLKDEYKVDLTKDTSYVLNLRAFATDNASSTDSNFTKPRLDVYVSGSKILPEIGLNDYRSTLTTANVTYPIGDDFQDVDGKFGTRVTTFELAASESLGNQVQAKFKALEDADNCDIFFVIRRGDWSIAKINLSTHIETGFSPNFVRQNVRIPTEFLNTPLAFKFNFFDFTGKVAEAEPIAFPVTFTGQNTYIDGNGNLITGSVFIGNATGEGIEVAGVNSGFIRSIGYGGFISASRTDRPGGFIIYSGSVLPSAPDNYDGVGIELVQDSSSFFKFNTNPGELDIRTNKFFLGSDSSFISGSGDGTIAISSSNFELGTDGAVIMQGKITAEAGGTIGGFDINSDNLSATNFELNTTDKRLTLGSSNEIFIADADEGIFLGNTDIIGAPFAVTLEGKLTASAGSIGGFEIDAHSLSTTGVEINDATQTMFISASTFKVDHLGNVTASNVDLSGKITAEEGAIGGFAITSDAITGSGFFISGGASGNDGLNKSNLFISSNNFKVTADGDITASSANLTGRIVAQSGNIGGWTIASTKLQSGDTELDGGNEALYFLNNTFGQTGIQIEGNEGSPRIFLGKSHGEFLQMETGTGKLSISGSTFFLGSATQFISGSEGNIELRADNAIISGSTVNIEAPRFFLGG